MSNVNLTKVILKTDYSRRFPDPLNNSLDTDPYNIEHHILLVKAIDVPSGISLDCNPRKQKIDSGIYKDVQKSLEDNSEPTFHLKNKGITMFAHKVDISEDKKVVTAYLAVPAGGIPDGIADGGHTYQIVLDSKSKNKCPDNQYLKFEIMTGVPDKKKAEIIGGLNTAVQVQEATLLNFEKEFDWIKETISKMSYADKIAYMQNEKGDFDIRDIIAFLTLFNVEHPDLKGRTPKEAYVSKAACLHLYESNKESYLMLRPLIKDILCLHDYIHLNLGKLYNKEKRESGSKGRAHGMEGVFDKKERGVKFIFLGEESQYKLFDGTLYPIFGAMRYLIEKKEGAKVYSWKLESFDEVKKVFDSVATDLLTATYNVCLANGRKPNPVGKDENHWGYLYQIVKSAYLEHIAK
jgi:hypothetical protein